MGFLRLLAGSVILLAIPSLYAEVNGLVARPLPFKPSQAKLLVVIHGCLQSAESMALGTGLTELAAKSNWVVYYPQVERNSHPLDCWTWYAPENQKPQQGQLRRLMNEIRELKQELKMNSAPTFLAGISSGGATVSGLLACFPNEFSAAAIHSGTSYGLARNLSEAETVLREGPQNNQASFCTPQQYRGRLLVLQGTEDKVLNPKNAERILTDFLPGSQALPARTGKENDLNFQVIDYVQNARLRGRLVLIEGLGHAWSGATENQRHPQILGPMTQIPFFSRQGPSATNLLWDFFSRK